MKVKSIVKLKDRFTPIEIEVVLVPGLPVIQFLGLPDRSIQESAQRIKSAIQSQGFVFPKAQQVLVNLYPPEIKKNSVGIEFAVALGILLETGQVDSSFLKDHFIYGNLRLNGDVSPPDDLGDLRLTPELRPLLTGKGVVSSFLARYEVENLKSISNPIFHQSKSLDIKTLRPDNYHDLEVGIELADLIRLVAVGEHPTLLAGPAGSGKTTLAKIIHELLDEPHPDELQDIVSNLTNDRTDSVWRPFIHPHHGITSVGLVGGGVPIVKGELFRANGGVLLLDELLEFSPSVVESLREPLEEGVIRLRKSNYRVEHRANILALATTNLCPCGDWTPDNPVYCGRTLSKCRSYLDKLSGPIVDRFSMIAFTKGKLNSHTVMVSQIRDELEKVRKFRIIQSEKYPLFRKVAKKWTMSDLKPFLPEFYMRQLFPKELSSRRRLLSTLQVARTFADFQDRVEILPVDIEKAMEYTIRPFNKLKRLNI